ncbi:MAG: DUF177 domain-containing protein [Sulfuricurvum sp.]|uniref:hypothetical protein n=1 Tax=Sulfuricurvum sp. TaxID=2025608 RepID=UPI0025DF3CB9|nr:hypothetical protein [Sulfuricurvum sp.]MCK9373373.1 DUF177 domain-containing protein [Sulfuricurvum sp.]
MTRIPFKHVNDNPLDFEVKRENAVFSGNLALKKRNLVQLNGTITGSISIPCDLCAEIVEKELNEEVHFYLSDGIVHGNSDELDLVEVENSSIDMDELFASELELIKSDYFCCSSCEGSSLEREF